MQSLQKYAFLFQHFEIKSFNILALVKTFTLLSVSCSSVSQKLNCCEEINLSHIDFFSSVRPYI